MGDIPIHGLNYGLKKYIEVGHKYGDDPLMYASYHLADFFRTYSMKIVEDEVLHKIVATVLSKHYSLKNKP